MLYIAINLPSIFFQIMLCLSPFSAPSHCLNHCWITVHWVRTNDPQWYLLPCIRPSMGCNDSFCENVYCCCLLPAVSGTWPCRWSVNIGSGNGFVPPGNKPLTEPMLTKMYMVSRGCNELNKNCYMTNSVQTSQFPVAYLASRALFQYPIRHLVVRSREDSKP